MAEISDLVGQTLSQVKNEDNEEILFSTTSGKKYRMYHAQDCCESVTVDDICGDLSDLVGSPITKAEETTNVNENPIGIKPPQCQDSFTWTFYNLATAKGHVTIRWYGE